MTDIPKELLPVIEKTEWVAIATAGAEGPHLAATWGDYVRALGIRDGTILVPAGGLAQTEKNLQTNPRIELLFATRSTQGSKGCLVRGQATVQASGPAFDAVKAKFQWARGALVIKIQEVKSQL